jgi:hypothetical protein
MLQTGFVAVDLPEFGSLGGVVRESENFIILQVQPALGSPEGRKLLVEEYERRQVDEGDEPAAIFLVSAFGIGVEAVPAPPDEFIDRGIVFKFVLPASESIPLAETLADVLSAEDADATVVELFGAGRLTEEERDRVLGQIARNARFLFAAGDVADPEDDEVEGSLAEERRVERFFLSPGLEGFEEKDAKRVASVVRAFLRNASAFSAEDGSGGLKLADTGLIVVGTPANSVQNVLGQGGDEQTAAIHVDFGIEGLGNDSKSNQRSTISATIGDVAYGVDGEIPGFDNEDADNEVVLRGRTIGSTRGPTEDDPTGQSGSVLAVGDVFNTAAGGGGTVNGQPLPGRATYLVIENFDPAQPETTGGAERPVGGAAAGERFALLRLATATQSTKLEVDPAQATELKGFAAALAEVASGAGGQLDLVPLVSGANENGLVLEFAPTDNRAQARLTLIDANTGETRQLSLGGTTGISTKGASAFVDPNRFGARTQGQDAEVAMVSGELVKDGLANLGEGEGADTKEFLGKLSDVDVPNLKWGFFFGDVDSGRIGEGARTHVHLGSWVAGKIADASRLPRNGTATYSGHAVGNVTNNGSAYTQIGNYRSTWNFGSRAGLTDLNFDGAHMRGFALADKGSVRFGGGLEGDGRSASIAGAFVRGNETGITPPAGQIGAFTVNGKAYGAAGTFAAKKN